MSTPFAGALTTENVSGLFSASVPPRTRLSAVSSGTVKAWASATGAVFGVVVCATLMVMVATAEFSAPSLTR